VSAAVKALKSRWTATWQEEESQKVSVNGMQEVSVNGMQEVSVNGMQEVSVN